MLRFDIINFLIAKKHYKKYLEIGVQKKKQNFDKIVCDYKVCVDPDKNSFSDYEMTSDEFFYRNKEKFDIVFVDGLHLCEQVLKDLVNSIKCLNLNGIIVCHDLLPINEKEQLRQYNSNSWTGDCWKAWMYFKKRNNNIKSYIVDTDHGVGIIENSENVDLRIENNCIIKEQDWECFLRSKNLMNIITVQEFMEKLI